LSSFSWVTLPVMPKPLAATVSADWTIATVAAEMCVSAWWISTGLPEVIPG